MKDDLRKLAARVRKWRTEAGFTLQQLADASGVSASTIHKLENLQTVPTVPVMLRLAKGLNRRPSEFLEDRGPAKKRFAISRRGERARFAVNDLFEAEHLVAGITDGVLDVWRLRFDSGYAEELLTNEIESPGDEMILLVEEGELEIRLDNETITISEGDTAHLDMTRPHSVVGQRPGPLCVVVTLMYAPSEGRENSFLERIEASVGKMGAIQLGA